MDVERFRIIRELKFNKISSRRSKVLWQSDEEDITPILASSALKQLIKDRKIGDRDLEARLTLVEHEEEAIVVLTRKNPSLVRDYALQREPSSIFEKALEEKHNALNRLGRMKEKRGSI